MLRRPLHDVPAYLDTPRGLVTSQGTHFRTTEALLEDFAGPVFARVPLADLVRRAEVWLRSAATLALWGTPFLLLTLPAWAAALLALVVYMSWSLVAPAVPVPALGPVLAVLEKPLVQAVLYVVVLTLLGWDGRIASVAVGLTGFVGFRLGALQALLRPLLAPTLARLYPLPVPDQVLRALIVRAALHHQVALPELERLEEQARAAWQRGSGRR